MSQAPLAEVTDPGTDYLGAFARLSQRIRDGQSFSGGERNCAFFTLGDSAFADLSFALGLDAADDADKEEVDTGSPGSAFQAAVETRDPFDGAHARIARTVTEAAAPVWLPNMPLDARVGDRKPTVAVKAERFWKAQAAHLGDHGHFDESERQRMAGGKPPRRRNPRTGDLEAMELVGLRAAADRSDVRMRWPGDSIDPWSAT